METMQRVRETCGSVIIFNGYHIQFRWMFGYPLQFSILFVPGDATDKEWVLATARIPQSKKKIEWICLALSKR